MKTITWIFLILAAIGCHAAPIAFEDVIAKPEKYHGQVIQIRGVFWTEERSVLMAPGTKELDLKHAIAIAGDPTKLKKDECWQKMNADRQCFIEETRKKNPNAGWVAFKAAVIFEGKFEDAASLAPKINDEGESYWIWFYGGFRWRLDLLRVVAYPADEEEKANDTDHISKAAAEKRIRAEGYIDNETKIVSARWSSDSKQWFFTTENPKLPKEFQVAHWFVSADGSDVSGGTCRH